MFRRLSKLFGVTALFVYSLHASPILNFFPVSSFDANTSAMDATLGVTGFTVDTFENATLIPGLTYTLGGGVPTTTYSTLPALFSESACGSLTADSVWDGTDGVTNTTGNAPSNCSTPTNIANTITFNYASGASSFGIGFGNFQSPNSPQFPITNHELFVNGIDMGELETLAGSNWTAGLARNAYLRIDGTGGTMITSVEIENLTASDVLVFDHLAVSGETPVPEPHYWPMLLAVIFLYLLWHRRRTITINS